MKNFFKYFTWTVIIGVILFISINIRLDLKEYLQNSFNLFGLLVFDVLFPVLIGILLRLPRFLREIRENKPWKLNWPKLLAIGLPTLYIILTMLSLSSSITNYVPFASKLSLLLTQNTAILTIIGVIFGYVLLDSIKKEG